MNSVEVTPMPAHLGTLTWQLATSRSIGAAIGPRSRGAQLRAAVRAAVGRLGVVIQIRAAFAWALWATVGRRGNTSPMQNALVAVVMTPGELAERERRAFAVGRPIIDVCPDGSRGA